MELVILVIVLFILIYFSIEGVYLHRNRDRIPIRIYVNGTRGKSSVVRLIIAGLRAGGKRVVAKTTGTTPCLIFPDGREETIVRAHIANIIEQLKVFEVAKKEKADAVVIECMALRPDLQRACERSIIHSTVGVITNVRADHLDVMGPTVQDVAAAFTGTLPGKGRRCYTAESNEQFLKILGEAADRKGSKLVRVDGVVITDEMMKGFPYLEHRDNVALALKVCEDFGIPRETALAGMHRSRPEAMVLRTIRFRDAGKEIEFVNAFKANDPDSLLKIWKRLSVQFKEGQTKIILLNTRRDRILRSVQMADLIVKRLQADFVFLTGESRPSVRRELIQEGLHADRILDCPPHPTLETYREMLKVSSSRWVVIFAMGNIGGEGYAYAQFFEHLGQKMLVHSLTEPRYSPKKPI